jgi:hypothetical protein
MTRPLWGLVALVAALLIVLVWLLPVEGRILWQSGSSEGAALLPHMVVEPANPLPGSAVLVSVSDSVSWAHVKLTVNGAPAAFVDWSERESGRLWRWRWRAEMPPAGEGMTVEFFHDCNTGCTRRGTLSMGQPPAPRPPLGAPTKLCLDFADPDRDWRNRQGWVVDMTYMRLADDELDPYWSVDALAARLAHASQKGLRVLVRVEFDRDQTLPPVDDQLALSEYLAFVRRLAQDDRLDMVYGYIIGNGTNADDTNQQAPERPLTPTWVARIFNGYGEDVMHNDNVLAIIRSANPLVRVLVGPVRAWNWDQDVAPAYPVDVPWLNYMDGLAAALDAGAKAKAEAGLAWGAPDGFAIQAPGRPLAPELAGSDPAEEPRREIARAEWNGAQAGFQIYREWIAVIDRYTSLQGLPVYIKSTNTFVPDEGVPPAQNYPQGWLTSAYSVVNADPRVQAMCWFLDVIPGDDRWDAFSMTHAQGRMLYAAEEFDALLRE